ncbi:MAG: dihydroneopterin aldolase [Hyphomicrobiales bacterium]|nr:dihydroneopterin aldolase [Hyphomicrobiales bacterium]
MTLMLASVVDTAEAMMALHGGADVIDAKDPGAGALGALPPPTVAAIVAALGGKVTTSAVAGDLPMEPALVSSAVAALQATGVDIVKIGLFPDPRLPDCIMALRPAASRGRLVAVLFADLAPDVTLLAKLAEAGFYGAMLDTAHKNSGRLLNHMEWAQLAGFVAACRAHGLVCGLAGGLEAPDIPRLLALEPDYLGFRGALCAHHSRTATLDKSALELVRSLIPPRTLPADLSEATMNILAQRSPQHGEGQEPTDTIFVENLVLPVRIGAYSFEEERPQDVRFSVRVGVARRQQGGDDMRGIFSYDLVIDAIRLIVASGHIAMVETLAEAIAQAVLAHADVHHVIVRVEKLDVIKGLVGVEIERRRPVRQATVVDLFNHGPEALA